MLRRLLAALPAPALATNEPPPAESADQGEIFVTSVSQRDPRDSASSVSVLTGAALNRSLRPQIGEALAQLPAVSSISFGAPPNLAM